MTSFEELAALDATIEHWWDGDVVRPGDPRRLSVESIDLPRPYVAGGTPSSPPWYSTMFSWDAYFTNLALLLHGRTDLVRDTIENYLAMIDRYGYMPNGNEIALCTRSQVPLFPDSILRYVRQTGDHELLARAYPALVREYRGYWLADHHATPVGLVTNRDLGDPVLDPRLAAEAETGLDWTPIYQGDVREIAPLVTNCALVRYAEVLATMADELGSPGEAAQWQADAEQRRALIKTLCWHEPTGFFHDYDHVRGRVVDHPALTGFWPLWAGAATPEQAARVAAALPRFEHEHGLTTTATAIPAPCPEIVPDQELQWMYPAGWPPLHIMVCWGLDRYGLAGAARRSVTGFLDTVLRHYRQTGELYEKYNVVDGTRSLPNSRYGAITLHGWTSAAAVLLGRRLRENHSIDDLLDARPDTDHDPVPLPRDAGDE